MDGRSEATGLLQWCGIVYSWLMSFDKSLPNANSIKLLEIGLKESSLAPDTGPVTCCHRLQLYMEVVLQKPLTSLHHGGIPTFRDNFPNTNRFEFSSTFKPSGQSAILDSSSCCRRQRNLAAVLASAQLCWTTVCIKGMIDRRASKWHYDA